MKKIFATILSALFSFCVYAGSTQVTASAVITSTCQIGSFTGGTMTLGNGLKLLGTGQAGGSLTVVPITVTGAAANVSISTPTLTLGGSPLTVSNAQAFLASSSNGTGLITQSGGTTGTIPVGSNVNYYVDLTFQQSAANFATGAYIGTTTISCY